MIQRHGIHNNLFSKYHTLNDILYSSNSVGCVLFLISTNKLLSFAHIYQSMISILYTLQSIHSLNNDLKRIEICHFKTVDEWPIIGPILIFFTVTALRDIGFHLFLYISTFKPLGSTDTLTELLSSCTQWLVWGHGLNLIPMFVYNSSPVNSFNSTKASNRF